jgi:hypothetical protein
METALFPEDPITPPNPPQPAAPSRGGRLLPGESSNLVSSGLVQVTPLAKHRKKKSAIRPNGDNPTIPLTIPTFVLKPEWTAMGQMKAPQTQQEADLVL